VALGREKGEEAVMKMQIRGPMDRATRWASGVLEGKGNYRHIVLALGIGGCCAAKVVIWDE
jgi:hypothetical protein